MSDALVKFQPTTTVDLADVATFEVTGPDTAEIAVEYREGLKLLMKEIEAAYRPHIQRAFVSHKALCDELKARLLPATIALDALNRAIGGYEVARVRAEEKARRDAEAAALAAAEAARASDAEAARLRGNTALAASIASAPVEEFMAPVVVPTTRKTSGVAVTGSYEPVVEDFDLLLRFALDPDSPPTLRALLVQPNLKGLQSLVDQLGEGFNVPGVARVMRTPTVRSTRTGRS
jgi:hypothetical protein